MTFPTAVQSVFLRRKAYDAIVLVSFALAIVPELYDAAHGQLRSVFRVLVFGNLLVMWMRSGAGGKRGTEVPQRQ